MPPSSGRPRNVSEICFEVVVDGVRKRWRWRGDDKISALLSTDALTLGAWLRAMRDIDDETTPVPVAGAASSPKR